MLWQTDHSANVILHDKWRLCFFIDFKAAFDTNSHQILFEQLINQGFTSLIRPVNAIYNNTKIYIIHDQ